jgi:hypothetical protein
MARRSRGFWPVTRGFTEDLRLVGIHSRSFARRSSRGRALSAKVFTTLISGAAGLPKRSWQTPVSKRFKTCLPWRVASIREHVPARNTSAPNGALHKQVATYPATPTAVLFRSSLSSEARLCGQTSTEPQVTQSVNIEESMRDDYGKCSS